jgi:hypothetical protein
MFDGSCDAVARYSDSTGLKPIKRNFPGPASRRQQMNGCSSLKTTSSAGISGTANRAGARAVEAVTPSQTERR